MNFGFACKRGNAARFCSIVPHPILVEAFHFPISGGQHATNVSPRAFTALRFLKNQYIPGTFLLRNDWPQNLLGSNLCFLGGLKFEALSGHKEFVSH